MAGNQGNNKIIWEQWQLDYLKNNWQSYTAQQLSEALGIKRTKVREKLYEWGFKKLELQFWTDEQIEFLKLNFKHYGDTELAEMFTDRWAKNKGWTKKHIEKKRRYLRLKRTTVEVKAIHKRNVDLGKFAICPINAWKTRGGASVVGSTRIWETPEGHQYMVIKLNEGFVHYARWLYTQIFGPPPHGCNVRLKDGNPENVTVSNLLLVTRSEHAILNTQNRHPEYTTARKLLKQIKTITKEHEKQIKRLEQSSVRTTGAS